MESSTARDEIGCPCCGESILRLASKCKHCGEILDPAAVERLRAGRAAGHGAAWVADDLVVPPGCDLAGGRCLICGRRDGVRRWTMTCTWTPAWAYLTLLVAVGLFVVPVATRRGRVSIPTCRRCRFRRFGFLAAGLVLAVGGLFAFPVAGGVIGNSLDPREGIFMGILAGFAAWIMALAAIAWGQRFEGVQCARIDDRGVHLRFARPERTREALAEREAN